MASLRLGLGPVFVYEWLTRSRRRSLYVGRAVFVGALLTMLGATWAYEGLSSNPSLNAFARLGSQFFYTLTLTQFTLIALAAPAAAAGAICLDRERGALTHMLVTDLSSVEIILGKLVARLIPALTLMACGLPVMFLGSLLGGIDPVAVLGAYIATTGMAVLLCTLALLLSVWGSKTHEVLAVTYFALFGWLIVYPISEVIGWSPVAFWKADPLQLTLAPYSAPGSVDWGNYLAFLGVTLLMSSALVAVAVLRVRKAAYPMGSRSRGRRRFFSLNRFGPPLDSHPVLWREWRRTRSSRWMRRVWILYYVLSLAFTATFIWSWLIQGKLNDESGLIGFGIMISFGLLLQSAGAATALAEERVRGSLDVLLTTPLTTKSIVWGKWCGAFRGVPLLAVLPSVVALSCAFVVDHGSTDALFVIPLTLVYGMAATSLGLALATWIRRPGVAVSLNVGIFALLSIGLLLVFLLFDGRDSMAGGSPFLGPVLALVVQESSPRGDLETWRTSLSVWISAYALIAVGFYFATLLTFDRCLGRASVRKTKTRTEGKTPVGRPRSNTTGAMPSIASLLPAES
jgi:ABC-type transport system involved in multi-copper enzyme maturation permease subunit